LFLVSASVENHVLTFFKCFQTILTGSSFLGLRSSVFVLYPPVTFGRILGKTVHIPTNGVAKSDPEIKQMIYDNSK